MDKALFSTLNMILKKDSKDTTYKYALLRALVEISEEAEQHIIREDAGFVVFPMGLIIDRWLYYYYPIIDRDLPQRNGEDPVSAVGEKIAFRRDFKELTDYYRSRGGFSAFSMQYRTGKIPGELIPTFIRLLKSLYACIKDNPMRHLGYSVYQDYYQLVSHNRDKLPVYMKQSLQDRIDPLWVIEHFGTFRLRKDFFELFRFIGALLIGTETIIQQWAEFTSRANSRQQLPVNEVLDVIHTGPEEKHLVDDARSVYMQTLDAGQRLACVWSGKALRADNMAVDHVLPFSLWANNDLWNLLPSRDSVNARKSDSIPEPDLIRSRGPDIKRYWYLLSEKYPKRFERELRISILGNMQTGHNWGDEALAALSSKCDYLISERGFQAWPG